MRTAGLEPAGEKVPLSNGTPSGTVDSAERRLEAGDDAYITEEDIRRAAARWEELAPPAMRHLPDAEPLDDDEPPPSAKI